MAKRKKNARTAKTAQNGDRVLKAAMADPAIHRRALKFLNDAIRPEDLMYEKAQVAHGEGDLFHEDNPEELKRRRQQIVGYAVAEELLRLRDTEYPLGSYNRKLWMKRKGDVPFWGCAGDQPQVPGATRGERYATYAGAYHWTDDGGHGGEGPGHVG